MRKLFFLLGMTCLMTSILTVPQGAEAKEPSFNDWHRTSFSLKASVSTLTLSPGQGGTVVLTLTERCRDYVTFAAQGFPSGVSGTFSPASSTTGSTLTVFVTANAAAGSYPITVTGTSGRTVEAAGFTLVVAAPNFTVEAPDSSLTLSRGASAVVPITVTPGPGFSGTVTFGLSGTPTGVTFSFAPASSPTGSQLTIGAAGTTAVGSYPVILTGTSGGATYSIAGTLVIQ